MSLTRSERIALELLSANPHRVITRDQLLDAVSEPGSDKNDRNVDFLINRLRRKLSDDARQPRFIATRYGEGYIWISETPLGLEEISAADAVIGPVRGLELVKDKEAARAIAHGIATKLTGAFGAEKRVVYAPDCPPPEHFGPVAPRHAAEITFFSDRGRLDCVVAVKEFRSRRTIFARRLDLDRRGPDNLGTGTLAADILDALWLTAVDESTRADPLPITLLKASGEDDVPPDEAETTSNRRLLSRHDEVTGKYLSQWQANDRRLRALLENSPSDPELKLLIALNTHSKYVTSGAKMFAAGHNTQELDEDEIEDFVTAALPAVRNDPEFTIIAGKLLHFLKRGYDDLARDLCEEAYAQSLSVGRSLAIIGQMRSYFGETDAALQCLDQALNLAKPGSQAHLYALVMKCQALSADARWDALESARRELAGANAIAGFVMEPMFGHPERPSIRSKALAFLIGRERARAMLMHKYYVSARLFSDPVRGGNSLRSLTRVFSARFGPEVVPDELRRSFPDLVPG